MSAAVAVPAQNQDQKTNSESDEARWQPALRLPCQFTVDLSLPSLKVREFLRLHPGSVLGTGWGVVRDVPLRINGVLIGWGELEGAGNRLAVRVTELA